MKRIVSVVLAAVAIFAAAPFLVEAQGLIREGLGRTFTSTAGSGVNGFECKTNGCRVDLGIGTNDHLYSDGTKVNSAGSFAAAGGDIYANGSLYAGIGGNASLYSQGYFRLTLGVALPTCTASYEGSEYRLTGTGGTNSGSETRLCVCVSDGAASPAYSWRNLISGTAGNATTCNP